MGTNQDKPPATTSDALQFATRCGTVWRSVKNDQEWTQEVAGYLARNLSGLTKADMLDGFDILVSFSKQVYQPPNPAEMLGCCRQAAARRSTTPRTHIPDGPRRLAGWPCPDCGEPRDYVPAEGVTYCYRCNSVGKPPEGMRFLDRPEVTPEEVEQAKADALAAVRRMGRKEL